MKNDFCNDQPSPERRKKTSVFKKIKRLFWCSVLVSILITVSIWKKLPDQQQLLQSAYNIQFIIEKNKSAIQFKQVIHSIPIPLQEMPDYLVAALITMEDRSFFNHFGISSMSIARPIKNYLDGNRITGGSTITQQLAKNLFFSSNRSLLRKYKEALLAIKISYYFSKEQVLEMYLNRIYFGNGAHGIEAASRLYFSKKTKKLSPFEAAILIGSIPAPNRYNYLDNRTQARNRGQLVLNTMRSINAFPAKRGSSTIRKGTEKLRKIDYMALLDSMRSTIAQQLGDRNGVFNIITTFDPKLQIYAELATHRFVDANQHRHVTEAGLISLEPTGAIKAMVGSLDRQISTYSHATQARRQPGSVFKVLVYLAALENDWKPASKLSGARLNISGWCPRNDNNKYPGEVTMQTALNQSINTATVRLMEKVGRTKIMEMSRRMETGCRLPDEPGLALGTGECTLLGITKAYAVLANKGVFTQPYSLSGIRNRMGDIVYWHQTTEQGAKQVVRYSIAKTMTKMLQGVVLWGTGKNAALPQEQAAGKTGTTQDNRDAWFIGYTEKLVTGIWLGNRDNSPMKGVYGGNLPALIWRNYMANAHDERENKTRFAFHERGVLIRFLGVSVPHFL